MLTLEEFKFSAKWLLYSAPPPATAEVGFVLFNSLIGKMVPFVYASYALELELEAV